MRNPDSPSNILELEESIDAELASLDRLFGGEGARIRGRRQDSAWKMRVAEAATLLGHAFEGSRKARFMLQEALTIPDFPALFGDVIDRQILAKYRGIEPTYPQWVRVSDVRDFRPVKRFLVDGAEGLLPIVKEQDEYEETSLSDSYATFAVQKRGRKIPFSWEAYINDDMQALQDIPERFANAASRSEEYFATTLLVASTGPRTDFFSAANHNIVTAAALPGYTMNGPDNPRLSLIGLQDAYALLSQQRDADGQPIVINGVILAVSPTDEILARNLLNATEVRINPQGGAGTAAQEIVTTNWMKERTTLVVLPYLPMIAGANGYHPWFLIADPKGSGRPAFEMGFLRGRRDPELFMKAPNAIRLGGGGGMVNPEEGDFENDSVQYKVRHTFGGVNVDPKMAVASTGANV